MAFNTYQYEFGGGDRTEKVLTIDFANVNPFQNVNKVSFFKEDDVTGTFQSKQFRYSFDSVVWSNWATLTQAGVQGIPINDNPNLYLHFRYSRENIGAADIRALYILYGTNVALAGTPEDPSIDADYLGGQPPSYYLDRGNFFGTEGSIGYFAENVDGSGVGTYDSTQVSSETTFFFKRINDSSNIFVTDTSGIITLDASIILTDASVSDLYGRIEVIDGSITYLSNYDAIQDVSILFNINEISQLDSSIIRLDAYNAIQDASILVIPSLQSVTDVGASTGNRIELISGISDKLRLKSIWPSGVANYMTFYDDTSIVGSVGKASGSVQDMYMIAWLEDIRLRAGKDIIFETNGSSQSKMIIKDDGSVGMGLPVVAPNPNYPLDVAGSINTRQKYLINGVDYNAIQDVSITYLFDYNAIQDISIAAGGSGFWSQVGNDIYYLDGSVGIGTSNPAFTLDVSGNINTRELSNADGVLKIQPDVQGNVELFGDTDVGDGSVGKSFTIHRKAAEGDSSLRMYVTSFQHISIGATGGDLIFDAAGGQNIVFGRNIDAGTDLEFGSKNSAVNPQYEFYGYVTAAAAPKYAYFQVDDATDKFILDREDASILGFKVNMPLEVDGSVNVTDNYYINDKPIQNIPIIEMSDVNITIDSSWNNYFIKLNPASDASVSFDQTTEGVNLTFENESSNTIYFYSGVGSPTLKSKDSAVTLASQYGMVTCIHDSSSWYLSGDLS